MIIGVTDEQTAPVEQYIEANGIQYTIALGGSAGYQTRGIPHAWLVGPSGSIEWEGYPGRLTDAMILEQLKYVRLRPTFKLPKELKKARGYLNDGKYTKGIQALEKYLKKPKSEKGAKAGKAALKKVKSYGREQLEAVDDLAEEGYYADAMDILSSLKKSFRGTDVGDKAKAKHSSWKKDKKIKLEIKAAKIITEAEELARKKQYKKAYGYLQAIVKSDKYAKTKCFAKAEKLAAKYRRRLLTAG